MIAIMWQFVVKPGREEDFERLYGADGDWTAANRVSRSYLGTSFLRDQNNPSRYVVTEYWSEMVVNERHRKHSADLTAEMQAHFALIEKRHGHYVVRERVVGFEPTETPTAAAQPTSTGGIKGRRKSKKDKLREAATRGRRTLAPAPAGAPPHSRHRCLTVPPQGGKLSASINLRLQRESM